MTEAFSPVPELNLLKEFYDAQDDFFANGFEMYEFEEVEPGLFEFAQANGSGSMYTLWKKDDRKDLATLPVVALGDEGGLHVVARDVREFLRLLASLPTDHEPDIDWSGFGVRGPYDPVENRHYLAWLEQTFGLRPVDDWETIVDRAQAELGREWTAWAHPRYPDAVWSPVHELNLLKDLNNVLFGGMANGVWMLADYGKWNKRNPLTNPARTADLVPFATNDRDTYFAVWWIDDRPDYADLPVVALGKDVGRHVVARTLREFLQLVGALTDTEIWCDDVQVGFRECEPAPRRREFLAWLEENTGLRPVDDPAAVVEAARAELGERLAAVR